MTRDTDQTATAIAASFFSPNEADANGEPANVVDGLFAIARAVHRLAAALEDEAAFNVKVEP